MNKKPLKIIFYIVCILSILSIISTIKDFNSENIRSSLICIACAGICYFNWKF